MTATMPGGLPARPRQVHLARVPAGLLVTLGVRRYAVAMPADALHDPDAECAVRAALQDRFGTLAVAAAPPPSSGTDLGPVWWFGGAWYACHATDADLARRVVRMQAPDEATASAWEQPGERFGLPAEADPDRAQVGTTLADLPSGHLARCADGVVTRHQLVPWAEVDPITGAAQRLVIRAPEPGSPTAFRHAHAVLPRTELGWPSWQADRLAPAGAFDPVGAREAAIAAAVAHLSGPWAGESHVRRCTIGALRRAGEAYLDPSDLAVTDPATVRDPRSPLTEIDRDQPIAWVAGRALVDEAPVWVPLRFVHTYADPPAVADQPPSSFHNLVGMAAARTLPEAIDRAHRHVIAHDAVAGWWRQADSPSLAAVLTPPALRRYWDSDALTLDLRVVPSHCSYHVILAVVRDRSADLVSLGFAAAAELENAAEQATVEGLIQLASSRDLNRPDSRIRNAVAGGAGAVALLPHRPRRDYLDLAPEIAGHASGSSSHTVLARPAVTDPMVHLQLGLDPRVVARLECRLGARATVEGGAVAQDVTTAVPTRDCAWVETTPPPLRASGWRAVRVVQPGCLRLEPAAFPIMPGAGAVERIPYPGW